MKQSMSQRFARQAGLNLLELMVSLAISMVVSLAMVTLMANTMSTGTQAIRMSTLTQEMRAAMQIITRELRRANHDITTLGCYQTRECVALETGSISTDGNCLSFAYDRAGAMSFCLAGGVLSLTNGGGSVAITDSEVITVNEFGVNCYNTGADDADQEGTLVMRAQLVNAHRDLPVVEHRLEDRVYPRNLIFTAGC